MDQNLPEKPVNQLLAFIKENQKLLLLLGVVSIVFIVIITAIIGMNNAVQPEQVRQNIAPTPTQQASQNNSPTTVIQQNTRYLTTSEKTIVEKDIRPQIAKNVAAEYTVSQVKSYNETWAIIEIASPQTDPARVVVKNENNNWVVKLGPGTYFEEDSLRAIGAPQGLIDDVNSIL